MYTHVTFIIASNMAAGILIHQGDTPGQLQPENLPVGAIWIFQYYMLNRSIEKDPCEQQLLDVNLVEMQSTPSRRHGPVCTMTKVQLLAIATNRRIGYKAMVEAFSRSILHYARDQNLKHNVFPHISLL